MNIKEAIECGLVTKKEITDVGTKAKLEYISDLRKKNAVREVRAAIKEIFPEFRSYGTSVLWCCANNPEELHRVRTALRTVLGSWTDELAYTNCIDDELQCNYAPKNEVSEVLMVRIEANFKIDNLPDGLLKPGCRVVKREKLEYAVRCDY